MPITSEDLQNLRQGQAPRDPILLRDMTLGADLWLNWFKVHYLDNFISNGGSKVKVLTGTEGSGKTHLLRWIEIQAQQLGYLTTFLDLRESTFRLSDIISLYKAISQSLDREELSRRLCVRVAKELGDLYEHYDGSVSIIPIMVENGFSRQNARHEILRSSQQIIANSDLSLSCATFAYNLINERMIEENGNMSSICWNWFHGERLESADKRRSRLYDRLTRPTARVWLYSLIRLIHLCGFKGLVILVDAVETVTERDPATNRYLYTPNQAKDTCELIRQLIDDVELQKNLMIVLSGRPQMVEDERRGFKSYEALWMRLQTGLVPVPDFYNKYADIVDVDLHLKASNAVNTIDSHLQRLFENAGLQREYREYPILNTPSVLRQRVSENANFTQEA